MSIKLKTFFVAVAIAIFSQSVMAQQPRLMLLTSNEGTDKTSDNKLSETVSNTVEKVSEKISEKASESKRSTATETKPNETELMLKEVEDLHRTVKLLEARIKELETKLDKSGEKSTTTTVVEKEIAALPNNSAVAPISKPEPLKPQDNKPSPVDKIASFFERTEVSGLVDVYYGYNFNRPDKDPNILVFENQYRNFDTEHNQFSLNQAKLVLTNTPDADHRIGFKLDLSFGPNAEIVNGAEPGGVGIFRNIEQAYISYLAPVGKGVQIDFGKYVTPHGFELIESKDNWNYSRSLFFTLNPYYHHGFRVTYPVHDKFTLSFLMHNGYNNTVDNNDRKSFSVQGIFKPTSKITFTQNYTGGPEQNKNNDDNRHLFDGILLYNINDKVSFATNYFYAFDRINKARVHAKGIVGYLRFTLKDGLSFSPRFEVLDDNDGFQSGRTQTLKSLTLTGEKIIKGGLITRLEYRRDFSDKAVFNKSIGRFVDGQTTLTMGIIYSFSTKQ